MVLRRLLAFAVSLAVCRPGVCTADSGVAVSTFTELETAVAADTGVISIRGSKIGFLRTLVVQASQAVSIEGKVRTTLDGGGSTGLFHLHKNSTLSLRSVNLVRGFVASSPGFSSGHGGGAVLLDHGSELLLHLVQISANRADIGGAICAVRSTVIAIDSTLTGNSAIEGGAIFAGNGSTVTTTGCTMTSNSASSGGAVYAEDGSTVTTTDCSMTSNSASSGGAVYAKDGSTVTATDCSMTSNSASSGGAVYAEEGSTVTATDCSMTSNSASSGGAVYAEEGSTVTATDCTMTSNSAYWYGGGHASLSATPASPSQPTVPQPTIPQPTVGQGLTPPPKPRPNIEEGLSPSQPTSRPSVARISKQSSRPITTTVLVLGCVVLFLMINLSVVVVRGLRRGGFAFHRTGEIQIVSIAQPDLIEQPLLGDATRSSSSADTSAADAVELIMASSAMGAYKMSPAPVFVVARSMRIILWSPGLATVAPMVTNPVGCLVSDLPFENASDGVRLHQSLERTFEAPAEHDRAQTFMLHDGAQNPLCDCVTTPVGVSESETVIVITGRLVTTCTHSESREARDMYCRRCGAHLAPTALISRSRSRSSRQTASSAARSVSTNSTYFFSRRRRPPLSELARGMIAPSSAASTFSQVSEIISSCGSQAGGETDGHSTLSNLASGSNRRCDAPLSFRSFAAPLMLVWLREDDRVLCGTLLVAPRQVIEESMLLKVRDDPLVTEEYGRVLRAPPGHGSAKFRFVRAVGENWLRVHVCPLDDDHSAMGGVVKPCDFVGLTRGSSDGTDGTGDGADGTGDGTTVCGVLSIGVLEVDEEGQLVRWVLRDTEPHPLEDVSFDDDEAGMVGVDRSTAHRAGLSGLPFDLLWLSLPTEIISDWESPENPPVELHGDRFFVKGSAVSNAALEDARGAVHAYLELKARVRSGADEEDERLLANVRDQMRDIGAPRWLKQGIRERRLSNQLLGFGRRGCRSVTFHRQYARLRLLLLARGDAGSPLQALGDDALAVVVGFLVPWQVRVAGWARGAELEEEDMASCFST